MIEVYTLSSPEGHCLVINGHRVAGPKPWGGGKVVNEWEVDEAQFAQALPLLVKLPNG